MSLLNRKGGLGSWGSVCGSVRSCALAIGLSALAIGLVGGCAPAGTSASNSSPRTGLGPLKVFPPDLDPERYSIVVREGRFEEIEGAWLALPQGEVVFNVQHRGTPPADAATPTPYLSAEQRAQSPAEVKLGLWIRGAGDARHLLPSFSTGPMYPEVQEDWRVELPPGDYELSITMGGRGSALLQVR